MRSRIFLISFILSLPVFFGLNVLAGGLEELFFLKKIANNHQFLTAAVGKDFLLNQERVIPKLTPGAENPEINAKSAISLWLDKEFRHRKILFEKEASKKIAIGSITKLMTANVVLENYDPFQVVRISKEAVEQDEDFGSFKRGETFKAKDLLYSLLLESSNDAAYALAEAVGREAFVDLMNLETEHILASVSQSTFFVNPHGLDPKNLEEPVNSSTAEDVAGIIIYLLKNQPLIWEIAALSEFNLYSSDGTFHHKVLNTNQLLGKIPRIIGGKTGQTVQAGGCLVLVSRAPYNQGFLINAVFGSEDRFGEMEKLLNWAEQSYNWF